MFGLFNKKKDTVNDKLNMVIEAFERVEKDLMKQVETQSAISDDFDDWVFNRSLTAGMDLILIDNYKVHFKETFPIQLKLAKNKTVDPTILKQLEVVADIYDAVCDYLLHSDIDKFIDIVAEEKFSIPTQFFLVTEALEGQKKIFDLIK